MARPYTVTKPLPSAAPARQNRRMAVVRAERPLQRAHGVERRRRRRTLRVATHLAPSVLPLYTFVADYVAARLFRRGRLIVATSYAECARDVDDLCFVCSVPYLLFAAQGRIDMEVVAAPVLIGDRYGGRPVYFSDVIVGASSAATCFEDLRGRVWAYNEPFSHSGYLVVLHHLVSIGEGAGFFGRWVEAGFHSEALRMVAGGRVDGAAIDSQVLAIELRDDPALAARLKVVGTIGPSTIQPLVVSASRLSQAERDEVKAALVDIGSDPAARGVLDAAMVERFVPIDGDGYADIRSMLGRVQQAGLLGAEWDERWAAAIGPGLAR
jgi:phosphonate transport system substrate-binding protein